ncbi:MAG: GntR family transcriptional regulator [Betaproteobacteria bacterium]|nr:GntR family transcriptional regulator [Betaproteobacteria bacterium]
MTKPLLVHRTLSAAIVERIRQDILDGRHAPGQPLRQDSLAASFGVSRIPVREALFQLEAEGLVRIEPHKGAIVLGLVPDEVDDVFDLRLLLEPRLLASSLPRLTDADFAEAQALDATFGDAIEQQDIARWGELNAELHLCLYRRATQPRTLSIVASLLQSSERYTRLQLGGLPELTRARREHRALIKLCRTGDSKAACKLLTAHIEEVRKDLQRLFQAPKRRARKGRSAS